MNYRRSVRLLSAIRQFAETGSWPQAPATTAHAAPVIHGVDLTQVSESLHRTGKTLHILPLSSIESIIDCLLGPSFHDSLRQAGLHSPAIDYISFYETHPLADPSVSIYANHWHTDDTLRPSAVKYFLLPQTLSERDGAMEYISGTSTKKNWDRSFSRGAELAYTEPAEPHRFCSSEQGLLLTPHWSLHRAGVPAQGHSRKMLLVQLNDRTKQASAAQLFKQQYLFEPTLKQEWSLRSRAPDEL